MLPFDFDRVVSGDGGERANGHPRGGEKNADDADRHRHLDDDLAVGVLDDHPTNVAFVDQLLDPVDEVTALDVDLASSAATNQTCYASTAVRSLRPSQRCKSWSRSRETSPLSSDTATSLPAPAADERDRNHRPFKQFRPDSRPQSAMRSAAAGRISAVRRAGHSAVTTVATMAIATVRGTRAI